MEISNTTKLPLRVPLPGGKKLHLGPGRTGQVSPKAADHPPLKKLLDEGKIEIMGGGRSKGSSSPGSGGSVKPSQGAPSSGGVRHTGDR
ncbi:MAG: hypothetical protein GY711_19710 [bacterium]|nr:hypothetical protein [bacterium]